MAPGTHSSTNLFESNNSERRCGTTPKHPEALEEMREHEDPPAEKMLFDLLRSK